MIYTNFMIVITSGREMRGKVWGGNRGLAIAVTFFSLKIEIWRKHQHVNYSHKPLCPVLKQYQAIDGRKIHYGGTVDAALQCLSVAHSIQEISALFLHSACFSKYVNVILMNLKCSKICPKHHFVKNIVFWRYKF